MDEYEKGNIIKCKSAEECIYKHCELKEKGILTRFIYKSNGNKVWWLEVTGTEFSWLNE